MKLTKHNLADINNVLIRSYDLFICSSSFEERCLSIANSLNKNCFDKSLIVSNIDLNQYVGANANKLREILSASSEIIEIKTTDPLFTADNIDSKLLNAIGSGFSGSILLDLTAFTHESLLILLRLIYLRYPVAKVTCTYSNAAEYSVGDDVMQKWLSRGVGEVRSVLGFPGNVVPSRKTHLILIVGYEHERASGIIEAIEPNSIALGFGRSGSATTDKDKEANEHYKHLIEQMMTSFPNVNSFEIPCDDPEGTRDEIIKQSAKACDSNILLAPMNNKITTIGAAMAALSDANIQLCYARALGYNYFGYSSPGSKFYIFDLNW
jgi:hypothetical protein